MDRYIFSIPDKENVHANLILLTNFYSCGRKFPKVHKNHIVVNRYSINVLNCVMIFNLIGLDIAKICCRYRNKYWLTVYVYRV